MRIVIDTNILIQMMMDADKPLYNLVTGQILDRTAARAAALLDALDKKGGSIIIPAPVLSEFMVGIKPEDRASYLAVISRRAVFEIRPFDARAALECAVMISPAEMRQATTPEATKAKLRFDRQILAIALAVGAAEIWTHDRGIRDKALELGMMRVASLADIEPIPEQVEMEMAPSP